MPGLRVRQQSARPILNHQRDINISEGRKEEFHAIGKATSLESGGILTESNIL